MPQPPAASDPLIAVAGPAAVDMTLRQPPPNWIGSVGDDVFTPQNLHMLAAPVELGLGGNGGACSYVLGKLGLRVHLNAPISDDAAGLLVRGWLSDAAVRVVAPCAASTMFALYAVDAGGKRLGCLHHPSQPIDWTLSGKDTEAHWFIACLNAAASPSQIEALEQSLCALRQSGCTTALDTGVAWMGRVQAEQVHQLWSQTDLLLGTIEELGAWCGRQTPQDVARATLDHGPARVVIKMGPQGAALQSLDTPFTHQPAEPVSSPDLSVGAGDAFNAAVVSHLARGAALNDAVSEAQKIAAKVVETGKGVFGWSGAE